QTITGTSTATTPDCSRLMELKSSSDTANSTINVTSGGVVDILNAGITNMTATGTTFNVTGIDNGNNIGWTFTQPPTKTLYWVGDALNGDWNDANNWAATSGGEGGYCVPTQFDDVIFDNNSDASVLVRILANQIGYCHDITVTGWNNGMLYILGGNNNSRLEIYGSSTWKNGMQYQVTTYYKSSDTGEQLIFDGVEHGNYTTYFEGTGGWT